MRSPFDRLGFKIILLALLLISRGMQAQISFQLLAPEAVVQGQGFEISFVLNDSEGTNFKAPVFSGFEVIGGPSYSTSTSFINGARSASLRISFQLLATNEGRKMIRPAEIYYKGKKLISNSKTITVNRQDAQAQSTAKPYFLAMEVSDSVAYIGQQIVVNYVVYYRSQLQLNRFVRESTYDGFYASDISQRGYERETAFIKGANYQKATIKSVALYPQKLGVLKIEPAVAGISIPDNESSQSFFLLRSMKSEQIMSNGHTIRVLPQPPNPPKSYSNGVGKYSITNNLRQNPQATDGGIILDMMVTGDGDSRLLKAPDLNLGDQFEVFEPQTLGEEMSIKGGRALYQKSWRYAIVPKESGMLKIAPEFSYLDPKSRTYKTLAPDTFSFEYTGPVNQVVEQSDQDSQFESFIQYKPGRPFLHVFNSAPYLGFIGVSICSLLFLFVRFKRLEKLERIPESELRKKNALKEFESDKMRLQELVQQKETKQFYAEMSLAIHRFLSAKYGIDTSMEKNQIAKEIEHISQSDDPSTANTYLSLMQSCETAVYASGLMASRMEDDLSKCGHFIERF